MTTPTFSTHPVESVSNIELYNRWAKVYDTDGNILQAIDDSLIPSLLSRASNLLSPRSPITITELGAGTGRNTVKLLNLSNGSTKVKAINALDLSPAMLSIARTSYQSVVSGGDGTTANTNTRATATPPPTSLSPQVSFLEFDALHPANFPEVRDLVGKADLVVSTLVLEHLPLDTFFETIASFLNPSGSYLVLTNMHSEMGNKSQAGFLDSSADLKIRGISYAHEISQVVDEGKKWGFVVEGTMEERRVRKEDIGVCKLLGDRGKKWIGLNVWFGCVMRFERKLE